MRKTGIVVRYGPNKGFGFLLEEPQGRREYFFHATDVIGRLSLRAGDKVTFQVGHPKPGAKSPVAILIELVSSQDHFVAVPE